MLERKLQGGYSRSGEVALDPRGGICAPDVACVAEDTAAVASPREGGYSRSGGLALAPLGGICAAEDAADAASAGLNIALSQCLGVLQLHEQLSNHQRVKYGWLLLHAALALA